MCSLVTKMFGRVTGGLGNKRMREDYPNYSIVEVRILRRVLETWGDLLSLMLLWKTISYVGVKNTQKSFLKKLSRSNNDNNIDNRQKKRTDRIVDFALPENHSGKIKENGKRDKYLDLARELKKIWTMKVTKIPIVISELRTIPKVLLRRLLELEIEWRVETIQTTELFRRLARILRRVLKTWEDLLSFRL